MRAFPRQWGTLNERPRPETTFAYPGLSTAAESEAARWIARLTGKAPAQKVSFGTEGGLFHNAGIPTVVCGPGSIEQAHKHDEYLATDQLAACDAFLIKMLQTLAKPS